MCDVQGSIGVRIDWIRVPWECASILEGVPRNAEPRPRRPKRANFGLSGIADLTAPGVTSILTLLWCMETSPSEFKRWSGIREKRRRMHKRMQPKLQLNRERE